MNKPKVIVVDDDPLNLGLIKMLLEMDGFEVISCGAIDEAIDAASTDIDAFVIDCYLSRDTSGLDLLTAVRNDQTNAASDTIVVMTSGDHRLETAALEKGANRFMLKPYPPGELTTVLAPLLAKGGENG